MYIKRVVAIATVFTLGVCSVGCLHTSLGEAPTDIDLRNDGADESRNHLYNKYKVVYEDGNFVRPYSAELRAAATSDRALNYVSTSTEAEDAMTTVPVALDRFASSPAFEASLLGMGLGAGGALGVFWAVQSIQSDGFSNPVTTDTITSNVLAVGYGTSAGAIAGFFASVPLSIITSLISRPLIRSVASVDYRAASKAFNKDLQVRIDAQTDSKINQQNANDSQAAGDSAQLDAERPVVVTQDQPKVIEEQTPEIEPLATAAEEHEMSDQVFTQTNKPEVVEPKVEVDERGEDVIVLPKEE